MIFYSQISSYSPQAEVTESSFIGKSCHVFLPSLFFQDFGLHGLGCEVCTPPLPIYSVVFNNDPGVIQSS